MDAKLRLDELLVKRGLFPDTHAAQAAVLAGEVVVGEHRQTSAGMRVCPDVAVRLKRTPRFASRGGVKLDAALDAFHIEVAGRNCIDLGASTGGFTDCLLQRGAARVAAVDVGSAQLSWRLRNDKRVDVHERTNVRGLDPATVGGPFDLAVADLSFISLSRVFGDVVCLLAPGAVFVSLIKPQFEVAKDEVGPGGIVRDAKLHAQVLERVLEISTRVGLQPQGLTHSPITGHKGNIEFLYWAVNDSEQASGDLSPRAIEHVVRTAHARLGGRK